jgi:Mg-chelatase subunit ChlD
VAHRVLKHSTEVIPLRLSSLLSSVSLVLSVCVAACSGDPTASVSDDRASGKTAKAPAGDTFGQSKAADAGASGGGPSCAATAVEAKLSPLSLVFMVDRSGSMGETAEKRQAKWDPVIGALKAFFTDATAAGVSASIGYFPVGDPDDKQYCAVSTYQEPAVALAPLPNMEIAASLDRTTPVGDGTPGAPALQGALAHATSIAAGSNDPIAVVFVTDGDPNKCASTPAAVAQIAATYRDKVPTYVIGVGSVATLNDIARAGGTGAAQIVSTTNPAQTRDELLKTIAKIRGAALPCEIAIPAPSARGTIDYEKVNLSLTVGGQTVELVNGKDCSGVAGWRYDDATNPTKVLLCPTTCNAAKGEGRLSVTFGCATKVL